MGTSSDIGVSGVSFAMLCSKALCSISALGISFDCGFGGCSIPPPHAGGPTEARRFRKLSKALASVSSPTVALIARITGYHEAADSEKPSTSSEAWKLRS